METRMERYNKKKLKNKLIISTIAIGLIAIFIVLIANKYL